MKALRSVYNGSAHFVKKTLHYLKKLAERSAEQRDVAVSELTTAP